MLCLFQFCVCACCDLHAYLSAIGDFKAHAKQISIIDLKLKPCYWRHSIQCAVCHHWRILLYETVMCPTSSRHSWSSIYSIKYFDCSMDNLIMILQVLCRQWVLLNLISKRRIEWISIIFFGILLKLILINFHANGASGGAIGITSVDVHQIKNSKFATEFVWADVYLLFITRLTAALSQFS